MKEELTVPNTWTDVTVKQYQLFEENISSNLKDKEKMIKSISILCGVDVKIVKKLKQKAIKEIALELNKLDTLKPLSMELKKTFNHNGIEYGLIPNLSEMTTGEFIDLETFCNDGAMKNLHGLLSILYRPIVGETNNFDQYNIESYEPNEEKENMMLDLSMDIALGCVNFFFHLGEQLITDSLNYLQKKKN